MTTPTGPAARALQRIRARHIANAEGHCAEDGQTWPCRTMIDADGDPPDDMVANAISRVRTAVTAAETQKPATVAEFKTLVRSALEPPTAPVPATPAPAPTTTTTPTVQP